jgi:hypothetical protein
LAFSLRTITTLGTTPTLSMVGQVGSFLKLNNCHMPIWSFQNFHLVNFKSIMESLG